METLEEIYETKFGDVKLTEAAQDYYVTFITWNQNTMYGGYGNHKKPFDISFHAYEKDAKEEMLRLIDKKDDITEEYLQDIKEWQNDYDFGDGQAHVTTVEDMFDYYNCRKPSEKGAGGILEQDIKHLELLRLLVRSKEVYVIMDSTANHEKDYISEEGKNVSDLYEAEWFDTEFEAKEKVANNRWNSWALVTSEEVFK